MTTKMIAQYAGFVNPDDFAQDVAAAISNTDDRTGETPVETALATTIATPGSDVRAAVNELVSSHPFGAFAPLRNVTLTTLGVGDVYPVDAIGSTLYGVNNVTLHRSTDDGATWQAVTTGTVGAPNAVRQLGNGEVIVGGSGAVYRSTGWAANPLTATWTKVFDATTNGGTNPAAAVVPFNLDVYDRYVLAGEYVTPDRTNSRYLRFSDDYGVTFTNLLDLNALYPGQETLTHWHGVCIDRWADTPSGIRLWASHGDGPRALMYSDDLGATFTTLSTDWQFTTLSACPAGIVCGTDEVPDGLYRVLRTTDPADMTVEPMHLLWYGGTSGALYGFTTRSFYHEQTGLTYVSFRADQGNAPGLILVSDGYVADEVYATPWIAPVTEPSQMCVVDGGSVHWRMTRSDTSATYHAKADQAVRGGKTSGLLARGGQLSGEALTKSAIGIGANVAAGDNSVVIGTDATAGGGVYENVVIGHVATADTASYQSVVIGKSARTRAHVSVAIGREADALEEGGTAIGHRTLAATNAVAIGNLAESGQAATTDGSNGVAIGYNSSNETPSGGVAIGYTAHVGPSASGGVAIGYEADATGIFGVAIAYAADATANAAVAVGTSAQATDTGAVALGGAANAGHQDAVALGRNTASTTINQVAIGARHIELTEMTAPSAPGANQARLFVQDNGAGKSQLCVRFATGAVQVIATEP